MNATKSTFRKPSSSYSFSLFTVIQMTVKLLHLQGIRGIAICSVVLFHYFPDYFPNGYLGVDLFFVLSGYLMSMMLARHSTIDFPIVIGFLYRRLKRIAPLYYFVTLATLGLLPFSSCNNIAPNLTNALHAILLKTNVADTSSVNNYFEKLNVARDFFTHTWSLCLEMQFYLLFPLLWFAQTKCKTEYRMFLLHLLCASSILLYFISKEKEAFNSVFARIWQFILGNMIFVLQQDSKNGEEYFPLVKEMPTDEEDQEKDLHSSNWIFASLSLFLLCYTFTTETHLTTNYSRITTTIISIILIHFGKDFKVLENGLMVFFGEVSYSWYLVHWPMVTMQKLHGYTAWHEMILGSLASLLLATLVHYLIEQNYLAWEKITTISCVLIMFISSLLSCQLIDRYVGCSTVQSSRSYKEMSKEQLVEYSRDLMTMDAVQLQFKDCVYDPPVPTWYGNCKFTESSQNKSTKLMIIGNSWTANVAHIVYEECRGHVGHIFASVQPSCEVLHSTNFTFCHDMEKDYLTQVQKIRPDYLMVIQRYVDFARNHSKEDMMDIMEEAKRKLADISESVKNKIYLLQVFPVPQYSFDQIKQAILTGIQPNWDYTVDGTASFDAARKSVEELARSCSKCELYDYMPSFTVNGTFYTNDPQYSVPFITEGYHLTLPALEKIRPVYSEMCRKFT